MGDMPSDRRPLYAAMLNLHNRLCVVVGGGTVALRKVKKLLAAGAQVRVISPVLHDTLRQYALEGRIEYLPRPYQTGDAATGFLIIAATDQPSVNRTIAVEAEEYEKFVNVVDDPQRCTFMVPAVYEQGNLQVAISTSGSDPAGAKRLKEDLAADLQQGTRRFQESMQKWADERNT